MCFIVFVFGSGVLFFRFVIFGSVDIVIFKFLLMWCFRFCLCLWVVFSCFLDCICCFCVFDRVFNVVLVVWFIFDRFVLVCWSRLFLEFFVFFVLVMVEKSFWCFSLIFFGVLISLVCFFLVFLCCLVRMLICWVVFEVCIF